jgi:hypothetical protein
VVVVEVLFTAEDEDEDEVAGIDMVPAKDAFLVRGEGVVGLLVLLLLLLLLLPIKDRDFDRPPAPLGVVVAGEEVVGVLVLLVVAVLDEATPPPLVAVGVEAMPGDDSCPV